jgi:NADPH:quinone reductase-like Zn-dependent oxidoreductase
MKEVFINPDTTVTLKDSPIPTPAAKQLVIKVVVAGFNPKDWKIPMRLKRSFNEGDDIAGYVHEVGEGVTGFKVRLKKPERYIREEEGGNITMGY